MIRKSLIVAVGIMASLALSVGSASATDPVHIENGEHILITGDQTLTLLAHTPLGTQVASRCDNDWEGHISEDGDVEVERVDFNATPGSIGSCGTSLNDCNDAGWHGNIEESAPGELMVNLSFCLTGTALGSTPVGGDVECVVIVLPNGTVIRIDCNDVTVQNQFPPAGTGGIVPRFEIDGELNVDGEGDDILASHL